MSVEILGLNSLDILLFGHFAPRIDIGEDAWNLQALTNTIGGGWRVANDSRCCRLEVGIDRGHVSRLGCHWALHPSDLSLDLRGRLDFFERALGQVSVRLEGAFATLLLELDLDLRFVSLGPDEINALRKAVQIGEDVASIVHEVFAFVLHRILTTNDLC